MKKIEIPFEKDRRGWYRFFEILPGFLSYFMLLLPAILSLINVTAALAFILIYLLVYFIRTSVAGPIRSIAGFRTHKQHMKLNWPALLRDVQAGKVMAKHSPDWHSENLERRQDFAKQYQPDNLVHAIIIATVNESREVLEPTIQCVLDSQYDMEKVILVFAYEGRAGKPTEERVQELLKVYGPRFKHAMAVCHPANMPGEVIGKGGNVTYAGRELAAYVDKEGIDPANVIVTTLDADNRPDPRYLAALSYMYCVSPNPLRASFQPLPMYTNNIWDAPTLMRVIATSSNLFYIVQTQRPHLQRNFSAHAQSLQSLLDMDFWSRRTVVEDGHHFWRSYFCYDGDYRVYPLFIPIYQDAVLADGYLRTIKAQFVQLRRWTYGASDVAYIANQIFMRKSPAPKWDSIGKMLRTLEGHVTWATGTTLVFFAAFVPPLIHPDAIGAQLLPNIVSNFQRVGILFLLASVYISLVTLPPRPARYKRRHSVLMVVQWAFAPVAAIGFGSLAAFNSQTRLMLRKYLSKFDVTEKAVRTESGHTISTNADPDN